MPWPQRRCARCGSVMRTPATASATTVAQGAMNRPEHLLHKLAMNALGICCVPLNGDHRPREMAYVLEHAKVDLVVVADDMQAAAAGRARRVRPPAGDGALRVLRPRPAAASAPALSTTPSAPDTPASVLYTSGTTGWPRAACCRTATSWKPAAGTQRRRAGLLRGRQRPVLQPPPLFHVNASIFSFYPSCCAATAGCRPTASARRAGGAGARVAGHGGALPGVVVPMLLLLQPPSPLDRGHRVLLPSAPASTRSHMKSSEARFGFHRSRSGYDRDGARDVRQPGARQVGTRLRPHCRGCRCAWSTTRPGRARRRRARCSSAISGGARARTSSAVA